MEVDNWIPFVAGEYTVEQAFVIAADDRAVAIADAFIEIFETAGGQRHLKGSGRIYNILLVELLEENDDLDIILDLGDEFKYRLVRPELRSGKFFAPRASSSFQFRPNGPWEQIAQPEFDRLISRLRVLEP